MGQWYGPQNYTVTQDFKTVSPDDIALKDVWGAWTMDNTNGLYPTQLIDRAWLGDLFGHQYMARCQFGNVRLVNNTFTEKYYLNNINRNDDDYIAILMTYQGTAITTGSDEILLEIKGNKVYLRHDILEFGYVITSTVYDKGYTIPVGVTSGNISYKAVAVNDGKTDALTGKVASNVNGMYDFYVYWEDTLAFTYSYEELIQTASSNLQRQADIRTNIGAPNEAYNLEILSHYEDVRVVQIDTDSSGYYVAMSWTTTLLGVLTWNIPISISNDPIMTPLLFLFVGLPEFGLGYIIVRLLRGGG
jgi:hypothetical protein